MSGTPLRSYVPLHLNALERQSGLTEMIQDWFGLPGLKPLEPKDWFLKGQDLIEGELDKTGIWMPRYTTGSHLWAPAPAAARVAVEMLRRARHS